MIDRQLRQCQNLQDLMRPILCKHHNLIIQLKQDIARFRELAEESRKKIQVFVNLLGSLRDQPAVVSTFCEE